MQHEFSAELPPLDDLIQDGMGQLTRVSGTRPIPSATGLLALAELQQQIGQRADSAFRPLLTRSA